MFKGRNGDIEGVLITSEGLLHALQSITSSAVTWRDWGLKAVAGAPSASSNRSPKSNESKEKSPSRKRRASEKDGSNKRRASEKDGSNKRRASEKDGSNKRRASEKDGSNKRRASEKDGSNKRRAKQFLSLNEKDITPCKLTWKPLA
jgi:hypothetical protein